MSNRTTLKAGDVVWLDRNLPSTKGRLARVKNICDTKSLLSSRLVRVVFLDDRWRELYYCTLEASRLELVPPLTLLAMQAED